MGIAKTSRKGKKAWRANISNKDVEQYLEKVAQEERSGGPLDAVPSEALFFVDKSKDTQLEKKTKKHQAKILHCESILQRSSLVPPLPFSRKRKAKQQERTLSKPCNKKLHAFEAGKVQEMSTNAVYDIWDEGIESGKRKDDMKVALKKQARKYSPPAVAAVEVDGPGCSYNPSFEDHQEVISVAVAQEMQKAYEKELEPLPVPRVVPGVEIDEEDRYFLEAGSGDDLELDEFEDGREDLSLGARPVRLKKLTKAERNKKARRREWLKLEEETKKQAKVQKDVQRLDDIMEEIAIEEEDKRRNWIRRTISRQEKRAQGPPRLGKHKFQPEPVQVLLSEEITGSLRKLKGCYTLLKERYKSLQRRGILEPRMPVRRRAWKKRVQYDQGTRGQKEREMHAAMVAERAARA